jgi:signal transduction histidine kinase
MPVTPRITFAGPLDSLVSAALADELAAVLRECLTNVAKHAHAQTVEIDLSIAAGVVTLRVEDDGTGIPPSVPLSGLANLTERATLLDGTCTIAQRTGGGTRITWAVPAEFGAEGRSS